MGLEVRFDQAGSSELFGLVAAALQALGLVPLQGQCAADLAKVRYSPSPQCREPSRRKGLLQKCTA